MLKTQFILWDIDGTLLKTGGAGQAAMEQAIAEEFAIGDALGTIHTAGRTDFGIVEEVFERVGIPNSAENRERFRIAYLERLPAQLAACQGALLAGTRELLSHFNGHDSVTQSLMTGNFESGAWAKLHHFNLASFFAFGVFGDTHPDRRSMARHALTVLHRNRGDAVSGAEICVIGDTPADIDCARAIGARVVAVATGQFDRPALESHSPDVLLDSFVEVNDAIRQIGELISS